MAVVHGISWGLTPSTLGDSGGLVTWSIAPAGLNTGIFPSGPGVSVDPNSFMNFDYEALIGQAFAEWAGAANIDFIQIADGGGAAGSGSAADIRIFFGPVPGSTLGYTFFPSNPVQAGAGDMIIDNLSSYNTDQNQFYELMLHEIGHALGLEHVPSGTQSVMTPSLTQSTLQPDDINGIRQIYGAPDNKPATYTMAANQTALHILQASGALVVNANSNSNHLTLSDQAENVIAGDGFDTVFGGGGNDSIFGQDKADLLHGEDGDDLLDGGQGFDLLYGEAGNDTLRAGEEPDRLYGGAGNDLLFAGTNFSITVDGLFGEEGDDTLYGEAGFDYLDGGTGNDWMDGGHQADNLYGREGNDTMRGDLGLDRLFGGEGDDLGLGGEGDDALFGEAGNDTLYGEAGNDRFFGGSGDDYLDGGDGNDSFVAGSGNDTIVGGAGNDTMQGNFNADRFVFADGHGVDIIQDFDALSGAEDIDLRAVSEITSFRDLVGSHMTQSGRDVLIDTGGGNSILLQGISIADLDESDFLF